MTASILVFCEENRLFAKHLQEDLGRVGVSFLEDNRAKDDIGNLNQQLKRGNHSIFLLLSDNFLRSVDCMYDALALIQDQAIKHRLKTIVIPGHNANVEVETKFEKVSNIIQYMNFWQDKYLAMRRAKSKILPEEEIVFNQDFEKVRSISTEVGEFLRVLRGQDYMPIERLEKEYFEWVFNAAGTSTLLEEYKQLPSLNKTVEKEIEEEIPVLLEAIPGMAMLGLVSAKTEENAMKMPEGKLIDKVIQFKQIETEGRQEEGLAHELNAISINEAIEETILEEAPVEIKETSIEEAEDPIRKAIILKAEALVEKYKEDIEIEEDELRHTVEDLITNEPVLSLEEMEKGALEEYMQGNPNDMDARYRYALMLLGKESLEAKSQLGFILNKDESYLKAYNLLADIAIEEEDFLLAKGYLEKSLVLDPSQYFSSYKLANVLNFEFKGSKKTALELYKESLKIEPENVDARYQMAVLLHEHKGKRKKALKQLFKVLQLDPKHLFAHYDLAVIYFENKDKHKAAEHYGKAIALNPELRTEQNDTAFLIDETELETKEAHLIREEEIHYNEIESIDDIISKNGIGIAATPAFQSQKEETTLAAVQANGLPAKQTPFLVFVTGATSGIGKATAIEFARNGNDLIITGRRKDRLDQLKFDLQDAYGVEVETLCFDVRDFESCKKQIETLPKKLKKIDILVNNAGLAKGLGPIHEGSLEHWEAMIDTNIKGLLYMTRLLSPYMVKRKKGHIINIGSIAGKEVYPNGNVYCGTKHAVVALTKGMRIDLHTHNVRVSCVNPAHVEETEFALVRFDGDGEKAKIYNDFKPVTSSDVAELVYFIATRPAHVNILDVVIQGTQQASAIFVDRSGR